MARVEEKKGLLFFVLLLLVIFEPLAEGATVLRPSFSITQEYTDNFFFTQHDQKGELTIILSPGLIITQKNRDLMLTGRYFGGIAQHLNDSGNNRYRQGLVLDIDLPFLSRSFKGVAVHISERAEHTQNRYVIQTGRTEPDVFVTERGRVDTFNNRAALRIDSRWSPQWLSTLTYDNAIVHYKESLLEDVRFHDVTLSSTYNMDRGRSSLTGSYGILKTDFEIAKRATAERISMRGKHLFDPTASLYGSIGESWVQGGTKRFISQIGASKQVQLTMLGIDYLRSVEAGDGVLAAVVLRQGLVVKAAMPMTVTTLFTLGLEYMNQSALSGPEAATFSRGLIAGFTKRFSPSLSGSIRYAYLEEAGRGVLVEDAKRNVVGFTVYASPAGWK